MKAHGYCSGCHRVKSVTVRGFPSDVGQCDDCIERASHACRTCGQVGEHTEYCTNRPLTSVGYFWHCQSVGCYQRLQCGSYCTRCGHPTSEVRA